MFQRLFLATLVALLPTSFAAAQEWGDLEATFLLKGNAKVDRIVPDKDLQVCGKIKLERENIVVNPVNKGIQNVAVYLLSATGPKPTVHPDYAKTAKDKIELDNKDCKYSPHVLSMLTTQTLVLKNTDPVGHNMKAEFFNNVPFNDLVPAGGQIEKTLTAAEAAFTPVTCSIHGWMGSHLMVREDPYIGISDKDGKLVIKNIPVGEWTFVTWQENAGYVGDVIVDGKPAKWLIGTRGIGRLKMTIKPGVNKLGTTPDAKGIIELTPAALKLPPG